MPVDVVQALQNINNQLTASFDQMNQRLDEALAISHNTQVLARNCHQGVPHAYQPLYKTVRLLQPLSRKPPKKSWKMIFYMFRKFW